jgi:hypothetical protein
VAKKLGKQQVNPGGSITHVNGYLMRMELGAGAGGSRTVDELEDEMDEEGVFLPGTATIRWTRSPPTPPFPHSSQCQQPPNINTPHPIRHSGRANTFPRSLPG